MSKVTFKEPSKFVGFRMSMQMWKSVKEIAVRKGFRTFSATVIFIIQAGIKALK